MSRQTRQAWRVCTGPGGEWAAGRKKGRIYWRRIQQRSVLRQMGRTGVSLGQISLGKVCGILRSAPCPGGGESAVWVNGLWYVRLRAVFVGVDAAALGLDYTP